METASSGSHKWISILSGASILVGLYLTTLYSYLLFHSIAEVFIVVVACGIFILAWNSRRFLDNNYLLFIGVAYLFIAILELIHALSYAGMGIFKGYGANLPTQFWIAARYMESLSLLIAPLFFGRKIKLNILFIAYTSVICLVFMTVFLWNIFPVCFVEETGLTPFKKISEYVICLIYIGSIALLYLKRNEFEVNVYRFLIVSVLFSIAAELAFTFYIHVYGLSNLIGHYFTLISFFFVYKAIIETGLVKPQTILYRKLKQSEENFRLSETRYRDLFDNIGSGVAIYEVLDSGNDFILKDFNKAAERLDGDRRESLIGKSIYEVRPSIKEFGLLDVFQRVWKTGVPEHFPAKEYRDDRLQKWYENFVYRLPSEEIVAVFDDITERKQVEEKMRESDERYRGLFDRSLDLVYLCDFEGNFIDANDAALEGLGYTKMDMKSLNFMSLLNKDQLPRAIEMVEEILNKGSQNSVAEFQLKRKDGEHISIESKGALVYRSGKPFAIQGIARNITERKKLEEEREKLIYELQQALKIVKQLGGLLPICMYCKKIRDDKGYWNQIESYIHAHSEAEFSHSICQECAKKYYPDMDLSDDKDD